MMSSHESGCQRVPDLNRFYACAVLVYDFRCGSHLKHHDQQHHCDTSCACYYACVTPPYASPPSSSPSLGVA